MSSRMNATAAWPFRARCHSSLAIFSCSASASGADVIIATPIRTFGSSPSRNGESASIWRSGWRKIWKPVCGRVSGTIPICTPIGSSAIRAVKCSAFGQHLGGQIEAADEAVAYKALHLGGRDQVDDARLATAVAFLALAQHIHDLVHLRERALAALEFVRNVLAQHLLERAVEGVGGEQVGDRPGQHNDVLGSFLDLPHALEIGDGGSDVFDSDAEQGGHRHAEEFGEFLQGLDLGELAFLESIERGAR